MLEGPLVTICIMTGANRVPLPSVCDSRGSDEKQTRFVCYIRLLLKLVPTREVNITLDRLDLELSVHHTKMSPFFLIRAPTIYIILVTVVPVSCFNESGWYLGINIWAVFTSTTQVRRLRVA